MNMNKNYLKLIFLILTAIIILFSQTHFVFANSVNSSDMSSKNDSFNLSNEMLMKIKKMPFDEETFKLTFQTLVYNSNIAAAYELAQIAVVKRPKDIVWHEKLAQTSTWVGDYNTAMQEWLYVVKHTNDINKIKYAISIAKLLAYDSVSVQMLQIYLVKCPDNIPAYLELARAQNRINQPKQALLTLQKINQTHPNRLAYELSAAIYQDMDDWSNALKIWQQIDRRYGPDTKSVMAEAVMIYMQGDFKRAVSILKQAIPTAKLNDNDYWQALADLAWIINERRLAILGYSHILNDSSNLVRLIELELLTNPKQAYSYSLRGWYHSHEQFFLIHALDLAQQFGQWHSINDLLMNLSGKELRAAEKTLPFWGAQANLYGAYGATDLQRKVLVQGIKLHPEMIELKSDLLWLVMTNGEYKSIKTLMEAWYEQNVWQDDLLWHAYAEGFDVLNQFNSSISMYQLHLFQDFQNDQVLIDYANILERAQLYQQAYDVRKYVWNRTLPKLYHSSLFDKESIEAISQVAPYFVSGTDQVQFFSTFTDTEMDNNQINILLNWMVPRGYIDLMSFFKAYYLNNELPDWAEINLALAHNDLPALQKIIKHTDRAWPRADRINAAVRLENTQLANELAFNELTERPSASEIYTEFTNYALHDANYINVGEAYEQFVTVAGPRTNFETKLRLTNEWKIRPFFYLWKLRTTDPGSIINVPDHDGELGLKLDQTIHRGNVTYSFGYRKSLNSFVPLAIDLNYQLAARWTGIVKLGYNQENFENSYMRVGGVQDQLNLGFIYNITKYDSLQAQAQGLNYYSQNRHYLANGYNLEGLLEHKFWLSYPDYTVGVFSNLYHFNRNGSFGGDVTRLFPTLVGSNNMTNYQLLIPNSYSEGGFIFSFGNTILEYTHAWRPYLWASLYYNSITHLSNNVKAGINGSVFGRDSLLIYGERGSAPSTANSVNYIIGLRYMLYF